MTRENLLVGIIESFKNEIMFLRDQIKHKDEFLTSQQNVISKLVNKNRTKGKAESQTDNKSVYDDCDDDSSISSGHTSQDDQNFLPVRSRNEVKKQQRNLKKRPSIVTQKKPEKNHFTNNYRNNEPSVPTKPLIALLGDSTTKNLSGYDLKKRFNGDINIMVRSQRGAKIKNIKNLMIDMIEDVTPTAICYHVGTNEISSDKELREIKDEFRELLLLTERQGIIPILSLATARSGRYASRVNELNDIMKDLCNDLRMGYIEHKNIGNEHLNASGLHIASKHTSLFGSNFVNFFKYLSENDFCVA